MSASKDKKLRRQQLEAGLDKRTIAAEKEARDRRRSTIQYTVIGVVIVLVFAFIFIYNSALPNKLMTAITIDGESYSVAQENYYYNAAYVNYYNDNILDVLTGNAFDTSTDLADQDYSEGYSWRDYFLDETVEDMKQIQYLNALAAADGFTMPEDYQSDYDSSIDSLQTSWSDYGYSSLQQYLNLNYGKGVTLDLLKSEMYRAVLSEAYAESIRDGYEYTDAELDAAYAEHADEYDMINYAYYYVTDDTIDPEALAESINGTDEDEFKARLAELADGAEPTTLTYAGSSLSDTYSDWLLDPAREPGDATAIASDGSDSTYVLMFLGRDTNDYNLVSFRHILINAEDTDEDGAYSDDEIAAAVARAQEIMDEWQAGDATEDSFGELANEYSDDTGSNTTGGLYEDVYKNQMVESINEWIFDPARKAGDTTIVTNDGSYTGAHLVYFVGSADMTYAHQQARDQLSQDQYDAWIADAVSGLSVTTAHQNMIGVNR